MGMDELVEHWTVLRGERSLIEAKHSATRLGFTLVLKFYTRYGRFPRGRAEFPDEVVEHVARQLKAPAGDFGFYEWAGRTIERHRGEIRSHLGFRECSVADADKLTGWLAASVAHAERDPGRVRVELLTRMREERIEPPADGRVGRMVASALRAAEQNWFAAIPARLDAAAMGRVLALVGWGEDTLGEETEDEPEDPESVLALIKSMPGNVSLQSMLTEIHKLKAARGIGLPARLFSAPISSTSTAAASATSVASPSAASSSSPSVGLGGPRASRTSGSTSPRTPSSRSDSARCASRSSSSLSRAFLVMAAMRLQNMVTTSSRSPPAGGVHQARQQRQPLIVPDLGQGVGVQHRGLAGEVRDLRRGHPLQPRAGLTQLIQPAQMGHMLLKPAYRGSRRRAGQRRQRLATGRIDHQQCGQPRSIGGIQPRPPGGRTRR